MPRSPRPPVRRRYHFHRPGVLYILVTLFMAVGAINSQNNLLFAALGLAIGGLLISGLISGSALLGIRVRRSAPAHASLGDPLPVVFHVSNVNRLVPAFGLHLVESTRDRELKAEATWGSFCPAPETFVVQVPPRASVEARVDLFPRRRGRLTLNAVGVYTSFPFGLIRKSVTFSIPQETLVHPPVLPVRPGVLRRLLSRAPVGQGSERAPGFGDEFFGLREYVPGDSLRRIAWKRSARTGDLVVRQNALPSPQRLWIVIRLLPAGAPRAQSLNERAIALGASLIRAAADAGVAVGLAVPGAGVLARPRLGRPQADRLLVELALLETGRLTSAAYPDAAGQFGACAIIHAGDADPAFGPRHAAHYASSQAEQFLVPGERAGRVLALLDRPPEAPPARGWVRRALIVVFRFLGGSA